MNGGTKWLGRLMQGIALLMSGQILAAPVDKPSAEATAKGWLADEHPHLAAKFHERVKSVETFSGYYVVHLEPEGFIVTAADDELEPVLAFADRGDFKYDPENPLCILLGRDVPARTEHLRRAKSRTNAPMANAISPANSTNADDVVVAASQRAHAKWAKYKNHPTRGTTNAPANAAATLGGSFAPTIFTLTGAAPLGDDTTNGNTAPPPVHIQSLKLVDGHVQLTHDSAASVTIYASYDYGQTWQPQDSGIIWPTWTSRQAAQELSCWYKVVPDGLYDAMTVSLMRNPPPVSQSLAVMTNADVSNPGSDPGLAGSKGSLSDVRVSPLVQSYWDQGQEQGQNCFNYYTPNNYVDGCVATALAQLMRYWQFPTAGIGQVSKTVYVNGASRTAMTRGGDGSGGAYAWSSMPLIPQGVTYNASQFQMIGSLCYDAGVSVNMQYSGGGSGAYMNQCAAALSGVFQYSNAKYIESTGDILTPVDSNLAAGCPVLFGISANGIDGHAVVCDGFGYDSGTLYHHINFGWSGAYNAWYTLPLLETPYGFNIIDTIIYNVFPSGTGQLLSGRVTTSQGAPVTGAAIAATGGGHSYSTTTDSKGYYGLKVPAAQTYSVASSKVGMGTVTRNNVVVGTSGNLSCGNVVNADITMANSFSFTAVGLTNSVWLRWTSPTNCGLTNTTVYIRYRTDRYPTNSSDGTQVYTGTEQVFEHTGVDHTGTVTNYYTIWGNDGSAYASLGPNVNAASLADPGTVRLLWTRSTGEVYTWNLATNGTHKSGCYANATSGLIDMTYWTPAGFADIDRDGVSDILWIGNGGEVVYWLLNADGTLKSAGRVYPGNATSSGYWKVMGFADIDRDGTADILWTGAGGEVVYWLLNPDGTRKSAGRVAPGNATASGYWKVSGFADIDGDGTADILWTGNGGEVVYWLLNADGTQRTAGRVAAGNATANNYWKLVGLRDINRDGTADAIWNGAGGEMVYWLLNANGSQRGAGRIYPGNVTHGYWTVAGFRDINNDGTADIIWRGAAGETKYWLLNADGTMNTAGFVDPTAAAPTMWTLRAAGSCGR